MAEKITTEWGAQFDAHLTETDTKKLNKWLRKVSAPYEKAQNLLEKFCIWYLSKKWQWNINVALNLSDGNNIQIWGAMKMEFENPKDVTIAPKVENKFNEGSVKIKGSVSMDMDLGESNPSKIYFGDIDTDTIEILPIAK